jgi:SLT domain-containing protein
VAVTNETILFTIEARERAAGIIAGIATKFEELGTKSKVSGMAAAAGINTLETATLKAESTIASYDRALVSQAASQARLKVVMEETAAAQTRVTAAAKLGASEQAAASAALTKAKAEEEKVFKATSDAQLLSNTRLKESKVASAEATAASNSHSTAMKGVQLGTIAVAAGIGAIMVESVKMATEFEKSTTLLVTGAGESSKSIEQVRTDILKMARDTGTSTDQLSKGMFMVASAGFHAGEGIKVLSAAAQGAKIDGADLDTMANALTSGLNAYGLSADHATSFTNMMGETMRNGKMHMQDLAASLSSVLPIAAAAGIGFDQVGGAMATMTSKGMTAQNAAQNLASTIKNLSNPSQVAVKAMEAMGLSSVDLQQHLSERGLTGTLMILHDAIIKKLGPDGIVLQDTFRNSRTASADLQIELGSMNGRLRDLSQSLMDGKLSHAEYLKAVKGLDEGSFNLGKQFAGTMDKTHSFNDMLTRGGPAAKTYIGELANMTGGQDGLKTALELTSDGGKTFIETVGKVGEAGKHMTGDVQGWAEKQATLSQKMDVFKETLKTTAITIGLALIPALKTIMDNINKVLEPIAKWIEKNPDWAAAIGTIIISLGLLTIALKAASTATDVLGGALKTLATNPFVAAGIAAGYLISKLVETTKQLQDQHKQWYDLTDAQTQSLGNASMGLNGFTDKIRMWAINTTTAVREWAQNQGLAIGGWVNSTATDFGHWVSRTKGSVDSWSEKTTTTITNWKANQEKTIADWAVNTWHSVENWAKNTWNTTEKWGKDTWKSTTDWSSRTWHDVSQYFQNLWHDVTQWVTNLWHDVENWFKNIWQTSTGWVTRTWHDVSQFFQNLWHDGVHWIDNMRNDLGNIFGDLWRNVSGWATRTWHDVVNSFNGMKNDAIQTFKDLANLAFVDPINFVINAVVNGGIDRVLGAINGVLGTNWHVHVNPMGHYAMGGIVPGSDTGRDTVPAMLRPGEGVLVPEAVRALGGANAIHALNRGGGVTTDSGGVQYASLGGIISDIWGGIKNVSNNVWNGIKSAGQWVMGGVSGVAQTVLNHTIYPLVDGLFKNGGMWGQVPSKETHKIGDALISFLSARDERDNAAAMATAGGPGGPGTIGGNLMAWIIAAENMTGVGPSWTSGLATLIMRESGGNPNAINNWDSNAAAGHPSKGLMQTIDSTFMGNHQPGTSYNVYDPVANIAAGINYIRRTYGGIQNVQQANPNMPHRGYDQGGWLPEGDTHAHNDSGRPEWVMTGHDQDWFHEAMERFERSRRWQEELMHRMNDRIQTWMHNNWNQISYQSHVGGLETVTQMGSGKALLDPLWGRNFGGQIPSPFGMAMPNIAGRMNYPPTSIPPLPAPRPPWHDDDDDDDDDDYGGHHYRRRWRGSRGMGGDIHVDMSGAHLLSDRAMDDFIDKMGNRIAQWSLPTGGWR